MSLVQQESLLVLFSSPNHSLNGAFSKSEWTLPKGMFSKCKNIAVIDCQHTSMPDGLLTICLVLFQCRF